MIILKINKPGLVINIPGVASFRSPAEIDVTKYDIRKLLSYLNSNSITEYEIISKDKNSYEIEPVKRKKEIKNISQDTAYETSENNNTVIDKRIDKIEELLLYLVKKQKNKTSIDSEQINRNINRIETLLLNNLHKTEDCTSVVERIKQQPEIEEIGFIPDIDISNMSMTTGNYTEIIANNNDAEETADLLQSLLKK